MNKKKEFFLSNKQITRIKRFRKSQEEYQRAITFFIGKLSFDYKV